MKSINDVQFLDYSVSNDFVGIKRDGESISVMLPLGYPMPQNEEEKKQTVIDLLDTVGLALDKTNDDVNLTLKNIDKMITIPIVSYLYLLSDYFNNGLYTEREKVYKNGTIGKINWKRTLRNKFYISNNQAVYLDTVVESNKAIETMITQIHILCINISLDMIGWLFGNFNEVDCSLSKENVDEYIQTIKFEFASTFNDNKKILLTHMLNILEYISEEGKYNNDIVTNTYYNAWEKMVDSMFGNEEASKFYPQGFYKIDGKQIMASNLRPDSILKHDKIMYILDAKYYKYGVDKRPDNLPNSESIHKQITYGEYVETLKQKLGCENVMNAFVIPYDKNNNPHNYNENLKYFGFASGNWRVNDKTYDKIALVFADCKFVIDNYTSKNKEVITNLIKEINNVLKEKE